MIIRKLADVPATPVAMDGVRDIRKQRYFWDEWCIGH